MTSLRVLPAEPDVIASTEDAVADAVEKILESAENRDAQSFTTAASFDGTEFGEMAPAPGAGDAQGLLSAREISQLSMLCNFELSKSNELANKGPGFSGVDGDTLAMLTSRLQNHIVLAGRIDIVKLACELIHGSSNSASSLSVMVGKWLCPPGLGSEYMAMLRLGIESASVLLFIMTSPGVDRRVINEDAIEASISLMKGHLTKNLVPALSNSGHLAHAKNERDSDGTPPPKKRRRSGSSADTSEVRALKKVYEPIVESVMLHVGLMERLENLVRNVPLDERHFLSLVSAAFHTFVIEPSAWTSKATTSPTLLLQEAAIGLITAVFRRYPSHRHVIIEDIFPVMLKLPTSRKSLRAFPVNYASALSPGKLSELVASLVPSLELDPRGRHCVQSISVLVLSLVQSCVIRPAHTNTDKGSSQLVSGIHGARVVCKMFATQLLTRCARKGEEGGASEFRPVLAHVVDDFLLLALLPEYPAAEMILYSLAEFIGCDLLDASKTSKASHGAAHSETTYLNTAFDALGKICAFEARIVVKQREHPIKMPLLAQSGSEARARCYCDVSALTNTLMVNCDGCRTWFHADCVGLNREAIPREWFCDSCQLSQIVKMGQSVVTPVLESAERPSAVVDEAFAVRRLLVEHLSHLSRTTRSSRTGLAWEFHLAQWIDELEHQGKIAEEKGDSGSKMESRGVVDRLLEQWDGGGEGSAGIASFEKILHSPSEEGGMRMILKLAAEKSRLVQSLSNQLGLLVKLMSNEAPPVLRRLSLKAIEKLVEADQRLMLNPVVVKAVSQRFADGSISVREAAVSLVGSYVVKAPEVANAFHSSFLPRLMDPGVSVRKRTIKILQDIMHSNPRYKGRAVACEKMLQRAADPKEDDSVRDLIYELFTKMWLENGDRLVFVRGTAKAESQRGAKVEFAEEISLSQSLSGMVTPSPSESPSPSTSSSQQGSGRVGVARSDLAAEQMVDVVKMAGNGDNLSALLKHLLCGATDADKDRNAADRHKHRQLADEHCTRLVSALFEKLLSTEEQRAGPAAKELVASMRTLAVFSEVSPVSLLPHLDTILPYLKADNGVSADDESAIVSAACDILFRISDAMDTHCVERIGAGAAGDDIVKITYKFGTCALSSAVRALSALSRRGGSAPGLGSFGRRLLKLSRTFYDYLFKNGGCADFSSSGTKTRNNVKRALSVLGAICRFHEAPADSPGWEDETEASSSDLLYPSELSWANLPVACFRLFSRYLQKVDVETKCAALRALSGIFGSNPRLMLAVEQSGTIESLMSDKTDITLQLEALQCWQDILKSEEDRIESGGAKAKMDSDEDMTISKRIAGDQDGDATLFGGVLTRHSQRLFQMTHSRNIRLRFAALEVLGLLLRQGLINPNEAVPYLYALQGDVNASFVRSLALKFLISEGQKRPDMLRQRICAGVKQAYYFQRSVYPDKAQVSALVKVAGGNGPEVDCVFSCVFKECVAGSRRQRLGLYRNLLSLFEPTEASCNKRANQNKNGDGARTVTELPLLSFAAQILAYLPYNTVGDPLFLVYHISSIVALHGAELLDRFATFLRPHGLSSSDEYDDTITSEDTLERAAKNKSPHQSKHVATLFSPGFDFDAFLGFCKEAASMVLLLRLKNFLKKAFNLNESRCIQYNPDSKERIADRAAPKKDSSVLFDSSMVVIADAPKKSEKDALVRFYAEFRQLMRAEISAVTRSSESET